MGSGNIGATNAIRAIGPAWGGLVFALDTGKGVAAVLLSMDPPTRIASGVAAILGHVFSPLAGFKGGRGVATSLGVFLALTPVPTLLALAVWVVLVALSRRVAVGSVGAALVYPLLLLWRAPHDEHRPLVLIAGTLVAVLIVLRHIPNLRRLLDGTEPPTFGRKGARP